MKRSNKLLLLLVAGGAVLGTANLMKKRVDSELVQEEAVPEEAYVEAIALAEDVAPSVDRIHEFFSTGINKLPIVKTVSYSPRVDWLEGRAAWIADYASHFGTSRHFIARSLNGKADYIKQKVSHGDRFNVLDPEKNFEFYLKVDISKCNLDFYYTDLDSGEKTLIKTYKVGLGRLDPTSPSGSLTPTGKYILGEKVGIYKEDSKGLFQENEADMIQIFGTRWIPFGDELEGCTMGAKGYGLHGNPWLPNPETGVLEECRDTVGQYDSDGCIRLNKEDIEELFSIIVSSRRTVIDISKEGPYVE